MNSYEWIDLCWMVGAKPQGLAVGGGPWAVAIAVKWLWIKADSLERVSPAAVYRFDIWPG